MGDVSSLHFLLAPEQRALTLWVFADVKQVAKQDQAPVFRVSRHVIFHFFTKMVDKLGTRVNRGILEDDPDQFTLLSYLLNLSMEVKNFVLQDEQDSLVH